jgi:hypothetical protein
MGLKELFFKEQIAKKLLKKINIKEVIQNLADNAIKTYSQYGPDATHYTKLNVLLKDPTFGSKIKEAVQPSILDKIVLSKYLKPALATIGIGTGIGAYKYNTLKNPENQLNKNYINIDNKKGMSILGGGLVGSTLGSTLGYLINKKSGALTGGVIGGLGGALLGSHLKL